ncbi:MAG: hypothetical protein GC192_11230 [Bacteroidetes bacterium]|nr:hypothetical protein [Bacteroidota bacterium]
MEKKLFGYWTQALASVPISCQQNSMQPDFLCPLLQKGFEISCKERQSRAIGKIFLEKQQNIGSAGLFSEKLST